jgi:hypothetical protein
MSENGSIISKDLQMATIVRREAWRMSIELLK